MKTRAPTPSHVSFPLHVLLVEDDLGDADDVRRMLAEVGAANYDVVHVLRLEQALAEIGKGSMDVVLLDLQLPDSDRGDTVPAVMETCPPQTAVVVVSGVADLELAAIAIQYGAQDYVVKGAFDADLLRRVILYAVERQRLQRELRDKQGQELAALKALVPFCAFCGKVRDRASNEWLTAEEYLARYAEVDATHGICRECRHEQVATMIEGNEDLDSGVRKFLSGIFRGRL